jgi:hypothetical protein
VPLPDVPSEIKVKLPFGELKGLHDFSQGIPSDCTVTFNLLLQLPPLLASLTCPLRVLNVIAKLKDVASATNPIDLIKALPNLLDAINQMSECLPPKIYLEFYCTIKDILLLILNFLKCLLDEMKSILNLRINISISEKEAEGNPVLLEALACSKANANRSMEHLNAATGPIGPVMDLVGMITGIIGLNLNLPKLASGTAVGDDLQSIQDTIDDLDQFVTTLKQVVEAIPC